MSKHAAKADFVSEFKKPEWLARLEDTIFEGLSDERAKNWPVEFGQAINEGADLKQVKVSFLITVLKHTLASISTTQFDRKENPGVVRTLDGSKAAVEEMICCLRDGIDLPARAAWSVAMSAARAAEAAAWSARSEAETAATPRAWSAEAAAWEAARAAREARGGVVWSAAEAAWSARSRRSAKLTKSAADVADAARSAAFDYYADRLIELLEGCKC